MSDFSIVPPGESSRLESARHVAEAVNATTERRLHFVEAGAGNFDEVYETETVYCRVRNDDVIGFAIMRLLECVLGPIPSAPSLTYPYTRRIPSALVDNEFIDTHGYLVFIAVHPDHQNDGHGTALLERVVDEYDAVSLHVQCENESACAVYESIGLVNRGSVSELYEDGSDAYYFSTPSLSDRFEAHDALGEYWEDRPV